MPQRHTLPKPARERGRIAPSRLAHVVMRTRRYREMVAWTTSMYYADPDGNQVELQVDNFDRVEELDAFLRGPAFRANPIGVDFDPEDLCARHAGGESHAALRRWPEIDPRGPETIPAAHIGRLHALLARLAARRRRA